jgi:hypothetical protein
MLCCIRSGEFPWRSQASRFANGLFGYRLDAVMGRAFGGRALNDLDTPEKARIDLGVCGWRVKIAHPIPISAVDTPGRRGAQLFTIR